MSDTQATQEQQTINAPMGAIVIYDDGHGNEAVALVTHSEGHHCHLHVFYPNQLHPVVKSDVPHFTYSKRGQKEHHWKRSMATS